MPAKRARKILRLFVWLLVILVVLAITLPLWLPWLLRPAAKRFGASFQTYDRLSYSRFVFGGVSYSNRNVRVQAKRLEVGLLDRHAAATDWSVIVRRSSRPSTNAPAGVYQTYQNVTKIVKKVQQWVPAATLTNGVVQTPNVTIQLQQVRWSGPDLNGLVSITNALPQTIVDAKLYGTKPIQVHLSTPAFALQSHLVITNTADGIFIQGANRWRTNEFAFDAAFATRGALPETVTLVANSAIVPPVKADLSFAWKQNQYVIIVRGQSLKEPLAFALRASGDTKRARLESVEISSPWAKAELQASVPLQYAAPFLQTNASFTISADLAQQPWISAQGQVEGRLTVYPTRTAEWSFSGRDVQAYNIQSPSINFTGSFSTSNFAHRGSIALQRVSSPWLKPLDASLNWSGVKADFSEVEARLTAGQNAISAVAAADLKEKHFRVINLALGTNQLDLAADFHWPNRASLRVQLTNLTAEMVKEFAELPYENVSLDQARFTAVWDNGPVTGEASFAGRTKLKDGTEFGAQGMLAAKSDGLWMTNLSLMRNHEPISVAHGLLPVLIVPTNKPFVVPLPDQPLQIQATAHRDAFFWKALAKRADFQIREADLRIDLGGTWKRPNGRVSLRVAQMQSRSAKAEVPPIENVSLVANIHESAAEIEFLNFFVTNQPVNFSARMPLPEGFWLAPPKRAADLDWRNLSCRLSIDSAQIAAFVPLLPWILVPQGTLNANLGLVPGGKLDGELRIDGAGTRPIAGLGALQDIEILCRFTEEKATVNSYAALGGYSVLGAGRLELNLNDLLRRELPPFEFHLTGENVPLTRQADAVIRADLDATIKHLPRQPAVISGKLNLRDSLYLHELRDLVPGKLASASRRPPYFSVTAKPFADWRLDLTANGQRFLKVRTPVFNGELSADFNLLGTLADPIAIGDVIVDNGLARFPFGNISIKQGIISLTSENPYRPQLLINGNERVLGYEVNMDITGYADSPVLQFSSTPPLSSEQILLMLTAGEIPRQGQFAFSPEQRAQRLAFFLGRGVLSDFGLGGDSNRLTIRSGENISETGRPTYSVEYELTPLWSVIGQYDQFNDFNLMLKWRVYAK